MIFASSCRERTSGLALLKTFALPWGVFIFEENHQFVPYTEMDFGV